MQRADLKKKKGVDLVKLEDVLQCKWTNKEEENVGYIANNAKIIWVFLFSFSFMHFNSLPHTFLMQKIRLFTYNSNLLRLQGQP